MKKGAVSFYFVLYLVAVITVFAITVERDNTLEQRNAIIAQLVEVSVRPLKLTPYEDTTKFFVPPEQTGMRDSVQMKIRVEGPLVKNDVRFTLLKAWHLNEDGKLVEQPVKGIVRNEGGDGLLTFAPLSEGTYLFQVSAYKHRVTVMGDRIKVVSAGGEYNIPYSSRLERVDKDTATLVAKVVRSGIEQQQLTLYVQEAQENWVLGPTYSKKIFIGGTESVQKATYEVSPVGRVEKPSGSESFVTFIWDDTKQGKRKITIASNGNRGLGGKDKANVSFEVNVLPATFVSPPMDKGFWGVPYRFDGQIAGVNPVDITVDISHDGQTIGSQPVVPAITITPERGWNTLAFKVLYKKAVIKEHKVSLIAPPPPQIRWVHQNLDRRNNVFTVNVAVADAAGGAVTMSIQSQPSGIATLDKIKGTSFTITVDLRSNPSGVYVKLLAKDQYGGKSESAKQFNVGQ